MNSVAVVPVSYKTTDVLKYSQDPYNTTVFNNDNIFSGLSDHRELIKTTCIIIYYNKKTMNTQTIGDEDWLKGTTKIQYKTTTVQLQN